MSNPTSHFIAAVLLVIAAAALGQNRDMPPGAQHKSLWTLDLRSSGLARERNFYKSPISMSFVDSDTLAVAWFVSQPQRNVYVDAPATLKAVYIDASTGRERSKAQWAASSRPLQVEITSSGKLLVRTGRSVRLFSAELTELHQRQFATPKPFRLAVSPDGERVFVCPQADNLTQAQFLNPDTLEVSSTLRLRANCGYYLVGDSATAVRTNNRSEVLVNDSGAWHSVHLPSSGAQVRFISGNVLASAGVCSQLVWLTASNGRTLLTLNLPKGRCWGEMSASHGGDYFGVVEERLRGLKSEALDMYPFPSPEQFVVYRISDQRQVFRVKVEGISPWFPKNVIEKFAISPKGDLVAIMTNGVIRAYATK